MGMDLTCATATDGAGARLHDSTHLGTGGEEEEKATEDYKERDGGTGKEPTGVGNMERSQQSGSGQS